MAYFWRQSANNPTQPAHRFAPFLAPSSSPASRIPNAGAASRATPVKAANGMTRAELAALAALPHSVTDHATARRALRLCTAL
jgi:hypothetical protein